MNRHSLTKAILGSTFLQTGVIVNAEGSISKGFEMDPLSSGLLEESFEGPISENFFSKLADLLSKLPNLFEGQVLLCRRALPNAEVEGYKTTLYFFERVQKAESYSHLQALLEELKLNPNPISREGWEELLTGIFGNAVRERKLPDLIWEKDSVRLEDRTIRTLSLTELPQLTWKGCLQPIFETPCDFTLLIRFSIPDRAKIKRTLETKRRVSHALSITSALEVRNIESNSVLSSSEETLERILVGKESFFEISMAAILIGSAEQTLATAREFERTISGIGNAGIFLEGLGTLPILKSHLPGNKTLGIRKLPILSENLGHLLPLFHDYSRKNDKSFLELRSRTGERSYLNLFSQENLNFNSFICGASGSGKSFLMNAILSSAVKDETGTRLCIFDVGGSYRRIIESHAGQSTALSSDEARALLSTFLQLYPVSSQGFYRTLIETLCGSGSHITHSHRVAIDDLLKEAEGQRLSIKELMGNANRRSERFYQDIAHWLKPHQSLDGIVAREDLVDLIKAQVTGFDFKELDSDPILQKNDYPPAHGIALEGLSSGTFPSDPDCLR